MSFADAMCELLSGLLETSDIKRDSLRPLFLDCFNAGSGLLDKMTLDLQAVRERDPACVSSLCAFLNLKGFQGLQAYRIANSLWEIGRYDVATWLANQASKIFCLDIHPAATIGSGVMLDHGSGIVIGETAVVECDVSILQDVTLGGTGKETGDRHPKVRQGVMIGAGAKIIGNIEIGANSKVAAGSVVLKNVPANCTVAGIPAQVVRVHNITDPPAELMDQKI